MMGLPPAMSLHLEGFSNECRSRGLSDPTITHYRSVVRRFLTWLERRGATPTDVDQYVLRDFLNYQRSRKVGKHRFREGLPLNPKTISNIFAVLTSFFDYLVFEQQMDQNPVPPVRRRYLHSYKSSPGPTSRRRILSDDELVGLVNSAFDPQLKAAIVLMAKTGVRRSELLNIDHEDLDFKTNTLILKPHAKRSNLTVFFDYETAFLLSKWLVLRPLYPGAADNPALFLGSSGGRMHGNTLYNRFSKVATLVGLHDAKSTKLEDHCSPHNLRHWFTTALRRGGMRREFIMELRGDSRSSESWARYDHIDLEELREAYLAAIPKLGL